MSVRVTSSARPLALYETADGQRARRGETLQNLQDRNKLKLLLEGVRGREDLLARRDHDPVSFVHIFESPSDRELAGLVASACAFGNVVAIRRKLAEFFDRLGGPPSLVAECPETLEARTQGFVHRLFVGYDLVRLLAGARRVQRQFGSMCEAFRADLATADQRYEPASAFREAVASMCDRIRAAGGLPQPGEREPSGRRGPLHLLPDVRGASASKRILLFLRWMIRPADGIDLGLWNVSPARLILPLDVHLHKLSKNIGLTRRKDVSWATATEVTRQLARLCPDDPLRYDFPLCHLGMVQRCESRRDRRVCEGCGLKAACVHWRRPERSGKGVSIGR